MSEKAVGLGMNIRFMRKRAGLTQQQLADKVGYNRTTVTNIERGHQPASLLQIQELSAACGYRAVLTFRREADQITI